MTRILTAILILLVGGWVSAAAPPGQAMNPDNSFVAGISSAAAFESLASSGAARDGVITAREFGKERRGLFLRLDANRDGELTFQEWAEASLRMDVVSQCALAILIRHDANFDGLLQRREFFGRPAAFVEADRDENNALHFEELLNLASSPKPMKYDPELFLRVHDLDGDQVIDVSEWKVAGTSFDLWEAIDANQDKMLTLTEVKSFLWRHERRVVPLFGTEGK